MEVRPYRIYCRKYAKILNKIEPSVQCGIVFLLLVCG
jgi:hypothetical protein